MSTMRRPLSRSILLFAALVACTVACTATAHAVELHSNGTGGGPWSDPATWRTKAVPKPDDDAVISRGDVVVFDRNDDGKVTCRQLYIDPRGTLVFKSGIGKVVFCAGGPIESFGTIKLDATRLAADSLELRLVAPTAEQRLVRFAKGGALLMAGRDNLPDGRRNATIASRALPPEKPAVATTAAAAATPPPVVKIDPLGEVDAIAGSTIDVRRADFINIHLKGTSIDNTGAKPNERLNIVENHFTGLSRVNVSSCDTPVIADNLFEYAGEALIAPAGIYVLGCPLAEIRGNTLRGRYSSGIMGYGQIDSSAINNSAEKCSNGMYWYGSNAMIKQFTARDCDTGVVITSMSGALEDITTENCKTGIYHGGATAQITNLQVLKVPKDGIYILYGSGPLTLLNCNILPEQIKFYDLKPTVAVGEAPRPLQVECMQFVVVAATGLIPPGASVELRTANPVPPLAPGAADLNVRNSPARVLKNGLTPLPQTLEPLIVRSWIFDPDGKLVPPPTYVLNLLPPPAAAGGPRPPLKTMMITPGPTWFREKPNANVPTARVTLP